MTISNHYNTLKQKSENYVPTELVDKLGFDGALRLAGEMLNNEQWDEELQNYAATLLEAIRSKYTSKWNSNWQYDALLGYAYDIVMNYDQKYLAFKRAFDKTDPPPPQLLVALASCCWAPGKLPLSEEEAVLLVQHAIKKIPYIEGVELLIGLNKSLGHTEEQKKWEKILSEIRNTGVHLPSLASILKSI